LGQNSLKIQPKFLLSLTSNPFFLPSRPAGPAIHHTPPPFPLQVATHRRPASLGRLPRQPGLPKSACAYALGRSRILEGKVPSLKAANASRASSTGLLARLVQAAHGPGLIPYLRPKQGSCHLRPRTTAPEPPWPPLLPPLNRNHYPPSIHALTSYNGLNLHS
jgi:hypothetical protein